MNPYKILGVDQYATKQDIIAAAVKAMKEKQFSGKEIAIAQKKLMNPVSKALHDFLYFIEFDDPSPGPPTAKTRDVRPPDLNYLPFPDLNE